MLQKLQLTWLSLYILFIFVNNILCDVMPLSSDNINIVKTGPYDLILINFYADWCHYSNHLKPVFEKAANEIPKNVTDYRILFGKVDCDKESKLCREYNVQKYPTIRIVKFGNLLKKEYRGARTIEGFTEFIRNSFQNPIKEISKLSDLNDHSDGFFMGYFDDQNSPDFKVYTTIAWILMDDYNVEFYAGFGSLVEKLHPPGQSILLFRPGPKHFQENDTLYEGNLRDIEGLKKWFMDVSKYFIREVSYVNAEEIMEEKKTLLILFRVKAKHADYETLYVNVIRNELMGKKDQLNFLVAEGKDFQHALFHLGKSLSDLPVIAVDSRSHMYMFPNIEDMKESGKLLQFIEDKLANPHSHHMHNLVIEVGQFGKKEVKQISNENEDSQKTTSAPIESVFKKLAPSRNRYTILHDEL